MMLEELRDEVWECLLELPKNRLVTMHSGTVNGRDPKTKPRLQCWAARSP
jgi:hypothetical protein